MRVSSVAAVLIHALLGAAYASAAVPAARPLTSADSASVRAIEAYTRPLAARGDLSGQLLVTRHGRVVAERCFGKANLELGVPVATETRFNVASLTKPMTVVLAIQLIGEGKLRVRDSIARWLPDFPSADSITVGMLLQHRSGIPHEIVPDSEMVRPFSTAQVVERARRLALDFPPGSRSSYSSGGFEVLARVLELASGRPYAELLEQRIFRPLGMTASSHADSRRLLPGRACAYVPGLHGIENAPLQDFSALVGAGSVWSTTRDLARFVDALVAGKLGDGARQSLVRAGRVDMNGRTGGFKAWAVWDSVSGVAGYFAGNVSSGAPDALKRDILRLAAGERVPPPTMPALASTMPPEAELGRWEGDFRIENGPQLSLRVRGGVLYANDWVMLPTANGAMFSPRDYGIVRAIFGADGRAARLEWTQGSETYPAPRADRSPP
jgi:CubicO group peptidase (beta-lactamase class C family)